MIPVLLILIPLVTGLVGFFLRSVAGAKTWALLSSLATLVISLWGLTLAKDSPLLHADVAWLPDLGSRFSVGMDGLSTILSLLTAVTFPLIFVATWRDSYRGKSWNFYALMLLSQAGLMGVFLATDALLFYFFWELALIPVYFLCSQWGGERRIAVTFKFFIYTFVGSLLMLAMYAVFFLWKLSGLDPYISLPLVTAGAFAVGFVLYRLVIGRFSHGKDENILLITLGVSIIADNAALLFFGGDTQTIDVPYAGDIIEIGAAFLPLPKVISCGAAAKRGLMPWSLRSWRKRWTKSPRSW